MTIFLRKSIIGSHFKRVPGNGKSKGCFETKTIPLIVTFLMVANQFLGAQCMPAKPIYKPGEHLHYEVAYNWGIIWINAGFVDFKVKETYYKGKHVYHFDAYGESRKSYDWIYKVRDHFQSYVSMDSLRPLWFQRDTYEGGYKVDNEYRFDYGRKKIYSATQNSDKPFTLDTLELDGCIFDIVSLSYYCRTLDFSKYRPNDKIPVISIIDNEIFELYLRYLGKEKIETKFGATYNCIKFSALLVEGTMFKGGEDIFVWVTDDELKIPVLVDAKILVGSVKAILKETKGTF